MDLGGVEERDVGAGDPRGNHGARLRPLVAFALGVATGVRRGPYLRWLRVADELACPQLRLLHVFADVVSDADAIALRRLLPGGSDAGNAAQHCGGAAAVACDRHRAAAA